MQLNRRKPWVMYCGFPLESNCRARALGSWVLSALAAVDIEEEKKMIERGNDLRGKDPYV